MQITFVNLFMFVCLLFSICIVFLGSEILVYQTFVYLIATHVALLTFGCMIVILFHSLNSDP